MHIKTNRSEKKSLNAQAPSLSKKRRSPVYKHKTNKPGGVILESASQPYRKGSLPVSAISRITKL